MATKKNKRILICILISVLLLTPIPLQVKDGGSVWYKAVLYTVYDVHRIKETNAGEDIEYCEGTRVEILGFTVFDNVT